VQNRKAATLLFKEATIVVEQSPLPHYRSAPQVYRARWGVDIWGELYRIVGFWACTACMPCYMTSGHSPVVPPSASRKTNMNQCVSTGSLADLDVVAEWNERASRRKKANNVL